MNESLGCYHIETGIDRAINNLDSFYNQISPIQRAVRDFARLDNSLTGKSGIAIRSFFNEVHQPFLIFLYQSMVDFQGVLVRMQDTIKSFEPDSNGFIESCV